MSYQKSILGCGFIPRNARAMCLKTHTYTKLGEGVYKIIKDPYELVLGGIRLRPRKYMVVNVLDALTGLTYAVKYEPANLVRSTLESKTDQPGEPVDFATRAGQIAEELKVMFDPAGGEFPTNAALHSLRFRTTETIKHLRASGFSAVEVGGCRRLSLRRVPRIPKSSKL